MEKNITEHIRKRYDRHIILPGIGEEGQKKLGKAKVLLVGVGGLGSAISLYLAAAGIGRIGLVDDDVVSESNLQRQVLYTENEVGQPKVLCAARRLRALNGRLVADTYPFRLNKENAEDLISRYDMVIDGCDNFTTRYLISDVSARLRKAYIHGTIREFYGQVAVFNLPGGKTYRELFPEEEINQTAMPPKGVMGVLPGVVGCVEASEAIKLVTGCGEPLNGRLWTIDLRTMDNFLFSL